MLESANATAVPPFWKRVLLLPFVPSMWAEARRWSAGKVVWPIIVSATLWSGALGLYRGIEFHGLLAGAAKDWDARFDPVIIENGEARVEGTRLPEGTDDRNLMLIDPEETRPTPSDKRYIIVRKHSIIRGDGPPVDLKSLQQFIGKSVRIDGKTMNAWLDEWGFALKFGMVALLVVFEWFGTVLGFIYGLIIGAILMSLFGKSRGLTGEGCTRIGFATMAVKPVLGVALGLLGTGVHPCLGLLVWPTVGVILGTWSLSRLPAVAEPPTPAPL